MDCLYCTSYLNPPLIKKKIGEKMKKKIINPQYEFLKSAISENSYIEDIETIKSWVRQQNEKVGVKIERIAFNNMRQWVIDPLTGALKHETGKFFSIEGISVSTNWGEVSRWDQPIINQPEVGYLGFIVKKIKGVLHFLVQAKIEPGNVNHVQLSPTIQATHSNYMQVHKGNKPLYLDYFQNVISENVLLDQLQSEQGARFLRKRNRNIIIHVNDEIPVYDNFIWLTLRQIKKLMKHDNLINMDTRTVISGIKYCELNENAIDIMQEVLNYNGSMNMGGFITSTVNSNYSLKSTTEIHHFITNIKSMYDLSVEKKSLKDIDEWVMSDDEISRGDGKYFKIIGVDVAISSREVKSWQQPMIQPCHNGICAFICKEINGIVHLIVQAKLECGNRDVIELAPTVQCLTGDYLNPQNQTPVFLDFVMKASDEQIVFDSLQSEEGGRFYKEQNRNIIVMADETFSEKLPDHYIWMTLNQLHYFNQFNNYLNIQARSLLSAFEL